MIQYFSKLPKILYDVNGDGIERLIASVIHRERLRKVIQDNAAVFYQYTVKDGETPEVIAAKYYENPALHWLVMLSNDMIDRYYAWPMSDSQFNLTMEKQYGNLPYAMRTVYKYYDGRGNEIDATDYANRIGSDRSTISIFDYWNNFNESLRKIKLVDKTFAPKIDSELDKLLDIKT
jgi:base plate wedge protein 53